MSRYKQYEIQCQQVRTSAIWKKKSGKIYRSYDQSDIDDEEQVRDLGKMLSNKPLSLFILEI